MKNPEVGGLTRLHFNREAVLKRGTTLLKLEWEIKYIQWMSRVDSTWVFTLYYSKRSTTLSLCHPKSKRKRMWHFSATVTCSQSSSHCFWVYSKWHILSKWNGKDRRCGQFLTPSMTSTVKVKIPSNINWIRIWNTKDTSLQPIIINCWQD